MPILVKHSGNPAPTAYGAFGGGQGKRYAQDATAAMADIQAEDAQKRSIGAAATEAERQRQFSADQTTKELDWRSKESELGRENQADQLNQQFNLQQYGADIAQTRQQQNIDYDYSAKQRAEYNNLTDAYDQAVKSGEFTPEELQDVHREILQQQAGIRPQARLKKKSIFPDGQDVGQTWSSEDGKFMLTRDQKGNIKKLAETNIAPTMKDIASLYEQANKALTTTDEDGVVSAPDPAEVESWVGRAVQLHQKYSGAASADVATPESTIMPAPTGYTDAERNTVLKDIAQQVQTESTKKNWAGGTKSTLTPVEGSREIMSRYYKKMGELAPAPGLTPPELPKEKKKGVLKNALAEDWNTTASMLMNSTDPTEKAILQKRLIELGGTVKDDAPKVASNADYDNIPSGTVFQAPDGTMRRKP